MRIEALESRRHLSGNVVVSLAGGALIVTGGAAANRVVLSRHPSDGTLRVTPLGGTTVNGSATELRFPNPGGPVRVDLGGGDDRVEFRRVSLRSNLSVTTGDGDDTVILRAANVSGKLAVNTGEGHDRVAIYASAVSGSTRVRTGAGDDRVVVRGTTFPASDTLIDAGAGTNDVDREVILNWDFNNGRQGWRPNVADFDPVINPEKTAIRYKAGVESARRETGFDTRVFKLSGQNLSDDLILYITRALTAADGIAADRKYSVQFTVTYLSNRPTDLIGGGSEYLKVGAVPRPIRRSVDPETGLYTLNIDRGNQVSDGPDGSLVGQVTNGRTGAERWAKVTKTHTHTSTPTSDPSGRLHLIVATESTFETATAMRYVSVGVKLTPVE